MIGSKILKSVLAGLSLEQLTTLLKAEFKDCPAFRSEQIFEWICKGVQSFDEMSNLPRKMRDELSDKFSLFSGDIVSELCDKDGTIKIGIKLEDSIVIEAVMLKDGKNRKTACLSTQAGCSLRCVFCKTGSLGFKRNLSALEITGQFFHLLSKEKGISHIVIMGMGEPLHNLGELRAAIDFFTDKKGLNISKKRITLSTSGIVNGILDLANNGPDVRFALSLTTARSELRERLMPITRTNSLQLIKKELLDYQKKKKRRITLEMVLLSGINTGSSEVIAVSEFAKGLNVVINLIPWNHVENLQFEGSPIKAPEPKEILLFKDALEKTGLKVTTRIEKGKSICGACGQLGIF